jgi:general secretion pathway protein B
MSLILEALRKSEQQRRLGETPTLATDSAWAARRWRGETARAARWPWIVLAVLLAAGGAAAWWLLAPRASAPDVAATADPIDTTTATAPGDAGPVAATPAAQAQPMPPAMVTAPPPPPPPPAAAPPAPVASVASTAAQAIDPSIRLEVPTPSPDGEYPQVPAPAEQAAATLVPSPTGPATAPSADSSAQVPTAPAIAPPPVAATTPAATPASPPDPTPAPAVAAPATDATGSSDVPPVYALSLAIRQALPPLRLSMHVWNADPARRFVILGETRAVEGETAGDDLRIVEIRRDGVVLEFRGTRFLLPHGGY